MGGKPGRAGPRLQRAFHKACVEFVDGLVSSPRLLHTPAAAAAGRDRGLLGLASLSRFAALEKLEREIQDLRKA